MLWSYISSTDARPYGTGLVGPEIALQVLIGWSLICPTIPCIRPLAMRFTTGGAIVLAGESRNTGDVPSTTRSHPGSQGLRKRHSQFAKSSQRQEQDEIELNPTRADRSAPTTRTSDDDDGQDSVEGCVANQGGIHVSRRYEVIIEGTKHQSETRTTAFPATSGAVASNGILYNC
jgi:hypothetical protein